MNLPNQNSNRVQAQTNRQQARNNPLWFTIVVGSIIALVVGSILSFAASDWVYLLITGIALMVAGGRLKKAKLPAIATNISKIGGPALQVVGGLAIAWIFAGSGIASLTTESVRALDKGAAELAKSINGEETVDTSRPLVEPCTGAFEEVGGCRLVTLTGDQEYEMVSLTNLCPTWTPDDDLVATRRGNITTLRSKSGHTQFMAVSIPKGTTFNDYSCR